MIIWNNIFLHQSCILEGAYRSSKCSDTVLRHWKTKLFSIQQTSKTRGKIALWNEARHLMNSLPPTLLNTFRKKKHAPLRSGTCNKNTGAPNPKSEALRECWINEPMLLNADSVFIYTGLSGKIDPKGRISVMISNFRNFAMNWE
jgi:hypothetical protein